MEGELSIDEDEGLDEIYQDKTGHLTEVHAQFFRDWEKLISLEEQETVKYKKEIWTMGAEERMALGRFVFPSSNRRGSLTYDISSINRCIANVKIDLDFVTPAPVSGAKIHRFTYRLRVGAPRSTQTSSQRRATSLLGGSMSVNDPVVVSLELPSVLSIARGFVLEVGTDDIVLGLDHSLTDNAQANRMKPRIEADDLVFRIDKDELAAGMGRIRDNLIQLFVVDGDEKRRRLIVDLEAPLFAPVAPHMLNAIATRYVPVGLNQDQLRAVDKVLEAKDYALILGMPGTGKTTTIAEILKALVANGKTVLLTSYTHSAVDNILLKVKDDGLKILRLGNRDKASSSF